MEKGASGVARFHWLAENLASFYFFSMLPQGVYTAPVAGRRSNVYTTPWYTKNQLVPSLAFLTPSSSLTTTKKHIAISPICYYDRLRLYTIERSATVLCSKT